MIAGCSVVGVRDGYEQSGYQVIATAGDAFEVRTYAPRVAAEATVAVGDEDEDGAFRTLFRYITGANEGGADIAMTVPVESTPQDGVDIAMTAPVETDTSDATVMRMRFFLPAQFTAETAPVPTAPNVKIIPIGKTTMAVRQFTGFGSDATVAEEREALMVALENSDWKPVAEPIAMFYDPPWTLPFFRRNEVAVIVEPAR